MPLPFKAILVAVWIGLSATAVSAATPAREMRVGFEAGAAPMSFIDREGRPVGFNPELVQAIAGEMDFRVIPVTGPWEQIFAKFEAGEIDALASVVYTPERDALIDYSVTHLRMTGAIFVRRDGRQVRIPADLAARRVGVQSRSFSHEYLRARGWDRHLVFVNTLPDALRALEEGRCDAVLALELVGNHIIRSEGLKNVATSEIVLPDYRFHLHMGVRAGDADRLAVLNEGLARIRENGTYDRIYAQWIGPLQTRPLRLADVRPFILPGLAVAAAVILAFSWQGRLFHQLATQKRRLQQSEERLRHVLEGSEDGFWDWDLETGRIERSERWASMLGYSLDEIPPTLDAGTALVHPDDLTAYQAWQTRLGSAATQRADIEYRMKAKSGEWRWILDRGKVVARARDGRPLRMAGTHTDITERKRTEAALEESRALEKRSAQLLEQTQSAAHIGGWETDLRTGRVYWTAETFRILEAEPGEFYPTRENIYQFYVAESRVRLMAAAERAIRNGTPYALELELVTAKQRRIHVHTAGMPEIENGRVVKLYGSFRDITAEKVAEQEREKLRLKMLEAQKLESLGVLAGGIAHDFNNLLTVILANATFVRSERPDDRIAHIETAARRAADLCRQMLSYAGKGSFIVERLDLGALVRDTTELIRVSISKKAKVELSLESGLPLVDGDVSQLRQVVMNLVINASEALGDSGGHIRIATGTGRPEPSASAVLHAFDLPAGPCVWVEISDTGAGMSGATLARIFDPFFTTKFAGRGLGLAAVLGIVRAHRGALAVQSSPGVGSTFRLFLPVSPPPRETPARGPIHASAPARAEGTILVADDEAIVLQTADVLLRSCGYQTVLANDGHEAVAQFRAQPKVFRAVLLDLTMPGLDGAEAARAIRATDPKVPLLVMSGFSEQDVFARIRGLGNVTIVRKPFTREVLLAHLAEVTAPPSASRSLPVASR